MEREAVAAEAPRGGPGRGVDPGGLSVGQGTGGMPTGQGSPVTAGMMSAPG